MTCIETIYFLDYAYGKLYIFCTGTIESGNLTDTGQLNYFFQQKCTWLLDSNVERQLSIQFVSNQNSESHQTLFQTKILIQSFFIKMSPIKCLNNESLKLLYYYSLMPHVSLTEESSFW